MFRLDARDVARLRAAPLTYEPAGTDGTPPEGYERLRVSRVVTSHRDRFDAVAEALMSWRVHERSGVEVHASAEVAAVDEVLVVRTWIGPLRVAAPCRIVDVLDEADRCGFAYGTLPGHPEAGEERFLVERVADGVRFTIDAFSRPASVLARAGAPFARRLQVRQTRRYLAAAESFADQPPGD